jgi:hypothetical protein
MSVLDHARGVLGEAFGVNHAIEVLGVESNEDAVGVTLDVDQVRGHVICSRTT